MKRLVAMALAAFWLTAAPPDPIAWKLDGAPAKPVKAGAQFSIKLVAKVQEGWHLYSMKPIPEGPIPTRIWLADGGVFRLAGAIRATTPETIQDPSFGMEVEQYEGEAEFTLPVRAAPGAPAGAQTLAVNVSYQSCNNKLCLPPRTVKVETPVTVAK